MSAVQAIPFDRLELSKKNLRRVRPGQSPHKQPVASIRHQGVLQNLVVVPLIGTRDRSGGVAGTRRLATVDDPVGKGENAALVAVAVSSTLDANTALEDGTASQALVQQVAFDAARRWRPNASNYLKRITRAQLLAIGEELCGSEWKMKHAKD